MKCSHRRSLVLSFAWLLACLAPAPLVADRTDVVVLANGDHITGEVKKLERGRLEYKTDDMGTIYVEWDNILNVTSRNDFQVELESGERHFGSLEPATEQRRMLVVGEEETVALDFDSVVRIAPIKETIWGRIDGSIDLGFSFTQANDETQLSLNLETNYRSRRRQRTVHLDSIFSRREGTEDVERNTLEYRDALFFKRKRLVWGLAQLQRNSELGLDLRSLIGGGAGLSVVQTNRTLLILGAGLGFAREDFALESSQTSIELILALHYSMFTYDYPNTEISVGLVVFPNLTESGRVRMELDSSVRREIVKDFYFNVTLFESFDNEVPKGAEESDWGVITSVGWTF